MGAEFKSMVIKTQAQKKMEKKFRAWNGSKGQKKEGGL